MPILFIQLLLVVVAQVAPKAVTRKFLASHLLVVVLELVVPLAAIKTAVLVAVLIIIPREGHQVLVFLDKEIMVATGMLMNPLAAAVALAQ
jgi:hypothetical protein